MKLSDFLLSAPEVKASKPEAVVDVTASIAPYEPAYPYLGTAYTGSSIVSRAEAMAVPSVSRARGILCSTAGSLPLEQYNKLSGAHVEPNRVINQPDPRVPGSLIYSWIAEDLLFHGFAYGQVLGLYADGKIESWTRISHERVAPVYNDFATEIIGYRLDGNDVPISGVGSIITFYGLDEGFLNRAGKTVRAALALESAAELFAKEPVPQMALKSTGTNLSPARIGALMSAWNTARKTRGTAFLNADIDLQILGIDPAKMQLNEARQYVALEIARHAGIPAYFLSAEQTSMTYSNAVSERKSLVDFGLRPILVAIEQRLSQPDFVSSSTEIRFSLDDFLRGDALQRAQVYEILNRIGAMSIEQVQEEEDLIKNA